MIKGNKNIDDLVRGKVYDYSTPPPDSVWDKIEISLSENKRRKAIILYFKIAAGITFLAGLTALYIQLSKSTYQKTVGSAVAETNISTLNRNNTNTTLNPVLQEEKIYAAKVKLRKLSKPNATPPDTSELSEDNPEFYAHPSEVKNAEKVTDQDNYSELSKISGINPAIAPSSQQFEIKEAIKSEKIIGDRNPNDILLDDLLADNEKEIIKRVNWLVGGQAGPQYTYRKLMNEGQTASSGSDYDSYDSPLLAYAGGLQIEIEPAKRLSVQSGVYYSKIGQKISSRNIVQERTDYYSETGTKNNKPVEIVNSIGTLSFSDNSDPNQPPVISSSDNAVAPIQSLNEKGDYSGQQYFEFIEIPFILKYKVIDQKFDFKIIGGINTDILVNNYAKVSNGNNSTLRSSANDLNTFNYSGTVGLGFDLPLTKRMLFSFEPFFKYYLSPINSSSSTEAHPYMFGIMSGINYSF